MNPLMLSRASWIMDYSFKLQANWFWDSIMAKPTYSADKSTAMIFPGLLHSFRKVLRFVLEKPITWLAEKVSSAPDKNAVMKALTELYQEAGKAKSRKLSLLNVNAVKQRIIIFSDQPRGVRDGSDNFAICENSYLPALEYYNNEKFYFINL